MKQFHCLLIRIKFFPLHSYATVSLTHSKELRKMRCNEECIFQCTLYSLSVFALETYMIQIPEEASAVQLIAFSGLKPDIGSY